MPSNAKKKSLKNLYGCILENLEDTSKKTIKTIKSLKLFTNPKIIEQMDLAFSSEEECDNYVNSVKSSMTHISPNKYKTPINKIKTAKISISYHKPKKRKMYYGSKTLRPKNRSKSQSKSRSNNHSRRGSKKQYYGRNHCDCDSSIGVKQLMMLVKKRGKIKD